LKIENVGDFRGVISELEICSEENNPKDLKSEKYFSMISSQ